MNPLLELHALGQRIWLDNLSRTLLREGTLAKLIADDGVAGVTSNPSIFFKAISESPYYRDEAAALRRDAGLTPEQRYERLAIADIQAACDLLRPLFDRTAGEDGYVSLEVSPALAHDAPGTIAAARRLKGAVQRDNLLIKARHAGGRGRRRDADRRRLLGQRHVDVFADACARRRAGVYPRPRQMDAAWR